MAAVSDVQRLQARVEELERWVYGSGGPRGSRKVADGLVKVQVALGNIASKRERVKILYKKIEDLIKYLDPEYIDRIAIPDASKLQFILAEEQFILSQIALLEQVEALVPMLDSAHIKAVPEHATRLQRLAQIHIQQQRGKGTCLATSGSLDSPSRTILRYQKIDDGKYPRISGDGVSLTMGGGAVFWFFVLFCFVLPFPGPKV
ncbi:dynactin subunit 3 isoform X2 [Panthera uncia]|uniref:dynactin subunit 3 isoform X2 n=1 Tax=Panthera uncia TaxID=29064 RepID=UPI0020FFF23E|nr:dynactin subunit 3 isoform X2 [Panthera uncia]